jgi:hypothetical protein
MAGDWIKFERATLHKPETYETAELLGISHREAVGLLVEYFCWLDEHMPDSRNGFVTHMSRASVESALRMPGFAAVLERVGWAKFDDAARTFIVSNHERHNGNTAKTRASAKDRQQRFRNQNVTADALPEKRREEKRRGSSRSNSKASAANHANGHLFGHVNGKTSEPLGSRLPTDWKLPPEWKDWAVAACPNLDPQRIVRISLDFRDYWLGKAGKDARKADWLATWRKWVRKEAERE